MGKRISINTVDGELESIEVDGVQYASPDAIPDPEDRTKVEALLAKSSGVEDAADADEAADDEDEEEDGFDEDKFMADFEREESEFHKEFERLENAAPTFPTLFFSIFFGIAVILLAITVFAAVQISGQIAREKSAPGRVVDMIQRRTVSSDSRTRQPDVYAYPVVEFNLPDGTLKRVELNEGSWPPAYHTGEAVTVLYDTQQPDQARIQSSTSNAMMWILPGITGFIGLAFLFVAALVFRSYRGARAKWAEKNVIAPA